MTDESEMECTFSEALDILEHDFGKSQGALLIQQLTDGTVDRVKLMADDQLKYVGPDTYRLFPQVQQ